MLKENEDKHLLQTTIVVSTEIFAVIILPVQLVPIEVDDKTLRKIKTSLKTPKLIHT